ncbi:phage head closure protein [Rhodoferax ferrireducens]|uniref:phage head closure protein n=1 Tax=Rhodoferax ferrireducens TaxID=192843 RepID=UPI00298DFAC6|nr:phage head closure protein [Rhodoferax ferrireducens]WPC65276.1 phage head closure protein [Rhodoferax ferrireducens]
MITGQLDQRVSIERLESGQDELGQPVIAWTPLYAVWAAVEPLSGREYFAASAAQSSVTTRIKLRYKPGITSADRVIHDGTTYNIQSVINYKSAKRELVLMCVG